MSETTFDYVFTDGISPADITVDVTVTTPPGVVSGLPGSAAYGVIAISGSIDGTPITGELGSPAAVQTAYGFDFDNAIFTNPNVVYGGGTSNDGIDFGGIMLQTGGGSANPVNINIYDNKGQFILYEKPGVPENITLVSVTPSIPCFCAGTLVLTDRGEVAVETLAIGDRVITTTGKSAPVRWIGRRAVSLRFADPLRALPIRVKANALGENIPARDLLLSPDHALLVDGVLIQAGALVNGVSIVREHQAPEPFTYYHVELADHSLILAENTPAETFVDNVDRMGFDNWAEHEALYGNEPSLLEMDLPRAKSARQVPAASRTRLAARAEALFGSLAAA